MIIDVSETLDFKPQMFQPQYKVAKGGDEMQAYCVKCRAKREMQNPKAITMKNGKPATQGTCPVCGTKMFRIGKAQRFLRYSSSPRSWRPESPASFIYRYIDDGTSIYYVWLMATLRKWYPYTERTINLANLGGDFIK